MDRPQQPDPKASLLVGRIMLAMGGVALLGAVLAASVGESIKPMGELMDGLTMWQLIGICAAMVGVTDAAVGAYFIRQARRAMDAANPGPKR